MNKHRLEQIERDAEKVLRDKRAWQAPVPIDAVAQRLGLQTEASAFGDDISGLLVIERGCGVIGYNSAHARVRQRFTIAHEIGHYLMHVKPSTQSRLFIDRYVAFRDDESSAGSDLEEVEANAFGAALLMPGPLIREEIRRRQLDLDDEDDLIALAKRFHVSTSAMSYRLVNLGLLR
jgi:Zn-dependent peptidase ImmA (M78 family)